MIFYLFFHIEWRGANLAGAGNSHKSCNPKTQKLPDNMVDELLITPG